MAVNVIRGALALSRNVIGLGGATVSDGSRGGIRCELVTCRAVFTNAADQRHGPADGGRQ
jgi:hypothetical protein